jgi:hypothetical protein
VSKFANNDSTSLFQTGQSDRGFASHRSCSLFKAALSSFSNNIRKLLILRLSERNRIAERGAARINVIPMHEPSKFPSAQIDHLYWLHSAFK